MTTAAPAFARLHATLPVLASGDADSLHSQRSAVDALAAVRRRARVGATRLAALTVPALPLIEDDMGEPQFVNVEVAMKSQLTTASTPVACAITRRPTSGYSDSAMVSTPPAATVEA